MSDDDDGDLHIRRGKTYRCEMKWYQEEEGSDVVILSGFTARMQIRQFPSSAEVLLELTDDDGGITVGVVEGTVDLYISAQDTAALDFDSPAYYDIELTSSGGEVPEFMSGRVILAPAITRGDESS